MTIGIHLGMFYSRVKMTAQSLDAFKATDILKLQHKDIRKALAKATLAITCAQSLGLPALAQERVAMSSLNSSLNVGRIGGSSETPAPDAASATTNDTTPKTDDAKVDDAKAKSAVNANTKGDIKDAGNNTADSTSAEASSASSGDKKATVHSAEVVDDVNAPRSAGGGTEKSASAPAPPGSPALTVDDVKIEGNRLVETDDILKVVKTKRGDKFDRDQIVQDLKAINELGYFDDRSLRVDPELSNGGVLLKIRVQENAPVSQFSFQGNQALSTEDIHKIFADQLEKPQNLSQLTKAIDKVEQAYHQKGFVLARVTDVKDDPDGSIALTINEGVIDDIQIAGNRKTKDYIVKNSIKIKSGQVYNEKQLTNDLRKLFANGYFQDIRRSLAPSSKDPDKYTLKVEVDEKRTGSVSLGGGVDSIYGPFGTAGFSDGNFQGKGQVLSFNGQMGSGMFGNMNNNLNNGGQTFLPNVKTYQVRADWVEPHLFGKDISLGVSSFANAMNSYTLDDTQQRTLGASVNLSKQLAKNVTGSVGISAEDTVMKDLSSLISGQQFLDQMATRAIQQGYANTIPSALQYATNQRNNILKGGAYLSINPAITYDTRDDKASPTRGMLARFTTTPSLGLNGTTFAKLDLNVSKYVPITKETTFATNFQAGTALGNVPGFAQSSLGGFNGIRGYRQFSDLGLGSSLLMARAEVRHSLPLPQTDSKIVKAIHKNVKVAFFVDAGQVGGSNIYNGLVGRSNQAAAAGVSLRVNIPMLGPIRIDYGYPLLSTLLGSRIPRLTFGFGDKF
jgi:outer membrane protein insertion porin family